MLPTPNDPDKIGPNSQATAALRMAIERAKQGDSPLDQKHIDHLLGEGFSLDKIEQDRREGRVFSVGPALAAQLGFKAKNEHGEIVSSGGAVYVWSPDFAQLRPDTAIYASAEDRAKGKRLKYLSPVGLPTQALLPWDGGKVEVLTEGRNDCEAISTFGRVSTGALTGVWNFKCLDLERVQGATILYDADAARNPQVFWAMLMAGRHVGGKVCFFPPIPGEPKGGAVEFFHWVRHRNRGQDISNGAAEVEAFSNEVLKTALEPAEMLKAWPQKWAGIEDETQLIALAEAAVKLSVEFLGDLAQDSFLNDVAKYSRFPKGSLKRVRGAYQKALEAKQEKERRLKERRESAQAKTGRTWTKDVELVGTIEATVRNEFFGERGDRWSIFQGEYHQWAGTHWRPVGLSNLKQQLTDFLACVYTGGQKGAQQFVHETAHNLRAASEYNMSSLDLTDALEDMGEARRYKLAFKNGTLDVTTGEFSETHDRGLFLTRVMPHNYDPSAGCPENFRQFLLTSYGEEKIELIRAVLAMYLDPSHPYGRFVALRGASGSGKGMLIHVLEKIIGEEYTTSINSLDDLNDVDKRHQQLGGRYLCKLPDVTGRLGKLDAFYALVQNESMQGRALRSSESYNKTWNCRFILASVKPLQNFDAADGWNRRVIQITSSKRDGFKKDLTLKDKLEAEIPQIISWALSQDRGERMNWLENTADLLSSTSEAMREAEIAGSSIKAFLEESAEPWDGTEYYTTRELHKVYQIYCNDAGLLPKGRSQFTHEMRSSFPSMYEDRRRARKGEAGDASGFLPARWAINLRQGLYEIDSYGSAAPRFNPAKLGEGGLDAVMGLTDHPTPPQNPETMPQEPITTPPESPAIAPAPVAPMPEGSDVFVLSEPSTMALIEQVEGGYQELADPVWLSEAIEDTTTTAGQFIAYIEAYGRAFILGEIAKKKTLVQERIKRVFNAAERKAIRRAPGWDVGMLRGWAEAMDRVSSHRELNELIRSLDVGQKRTLWCCLPPDTREHLRGIGA
jgi:hypothetical protein